MMRTVHSNMEIKQERSSRKLCDFPRNNVFDEHQGEMKYQILEISQWNYDQVYFSKQYEFRHFKKGSFVTTIIHFLLFETVCNFMNQVMNAGQTNKEHYHFGVRQLD